MNDRESIVEDLKRIADETACSERADVCRELATRYQRGDDLKPAKAPATVADLLALNDLDLGALACRAGVGGGVASQADEDALRAVYTEDGDLRFDMVFKAVRDAEMARRVAARGAKVRAALSQMDKGAAKGVGAIIDAAIRYRDAQKVWIEVCKSVEGVGGIEAEAKIIAAWQPVNDARGDMCSAAEALP